MKIVKFFFWPSERAQSLWTLSPEPVDPEPRACGPHFEFWRFAENAQYLRGGVNWFLNVHILMSQNQSKNKSPSKIDGFTPFSPGLWCFSIHISIKFIQKEQSS